jgi:glycosyltransferase involved in cell wall biosynthesis
MIDGAETVVMALATVACALLGMSYWSLVAGALSGFAVSTVMCLVIRPHRVSLPRDLRAMSGSLSFGGHVVLSQFAWYTYSNADFAVVGRILGRAALGAYTFAWTIANVPVDRVTGLVQRVTAPIFSAVQHDKVQLRYYVTALTEGLALATFPLCAGLALVAQPLIRVMLGPTWQEAVVPLQLLSIYAAFRCVTSLLAQVLIFTGNAKRNMQLSIVAALVLPVSFYIGSNWGTTGVSAAWVTVYPAVVGSLYVRDTLRTVEMTLAEYFRALRPAVAGTIVMAAVVTGLGILVDGKVLPSIALALMVAAGAGVYLAYVVVLHGRRVRGLIDVFRGTTIGVPAPSFVVEPSGVQRTTRLLLVSWHFPPDSAVGGLRWQKFARHAAERGWGVDVIMRDPRGLAGADPERLADLPPGTRIWFVPLRPLRFERWAEAFARGVRSVVRRPALPQTPSAATGARTTTRDSRTQSEIGFPRSWRDVARAYFSAVELLRGARWAADAARVGETIIVNGTHRATVSSGPPHFVHDAADQIARATGIPFIMDLRDPWSLVQRLPECFASPVTTVLAKRDEKRAVRNAALVVTNTEPAADAMRSRHAEAASRIIAVPNGFDEDVIPPTRPSTAFTLAYAGTIYLDRDPRPLFRAAASVIRRFTLTPEDFRIEFMGEVSVFDGVPISQIAADEGMASFVGIRAAGTRREALEFLAGASMLVILPQDSDYAIPAKLFEYMRFDAWLLVLADQGSATSRLLAGVEADVMPPDDAEAIRRAIEQRWVQHSRGERPRSLSHHRHLSRRARAEILFGAIERSWRQPRGDGITEFAVVDYDQASAPSSVFASATPRASDSADPVVESSSASSAFHALRTVTSSAMIMPNTKYR